MGLKIMEKMPVGQLLMSIASVHTAMGKPLKENIDVSLNETPLLKIFKWALNSSMDLDLPLVRVIGRDEDDAENVEATTHYYNSSSPNYPETHNADSLSIMWYLASFGALVMFFLLISFSEVCCKKSFTVPPEEEIEVSPPPYDLFAPPTYDSLYEDKKEKGRKMKKKRRKCEVFVIHVFGDKSASRVAPMEAMHRSDPRNGQRMTPPPPP